MRRDMVFAGIVFVVCVAIAVAQPPLAPPPPSPPVPPPVVPSGGTNPVPAPATARQSIPSDTLLSKFEPLSAFPATTQFAVRSVLLGANWLTRMNQVQGRFVYGYIPALRQPMEGDHDLKQALATLALVHAARFTGDNRQVAVASQAILALLSVTKVEATEPNCRYPVRSSLYCNRVGFAAILALCIYDLPGADEKLIAEAERLSAFLQKHIRPDGSIHSTDSPNDKPTQIDPDGINEYPGYALQALAEGHRVKPAAWKAGALRKSLEYYRALFRTNPHPMLAATLTPAFTEFNSQARSPDAIAAVFEMNDWLIQLQYPSTDPRHPRWVGGFRGWSNAQPVETVPGYKCGAYLQSLACAYRLTRQVPDLAREARFKPAVLDAVQFVSGLQYVEANTRHFENSFRANTLIGGFYLSPVDGNLRIDASGAAVLGMLQFLSCGAER